MSMCIEVEARTIYTVCLTDEDMAKVKKWIQEHEEDLPSFDMEDNIAWAVARLYEEDEISLYDDEKATESDFYTDKVRWSEFEERTPEEILNQLNNSSIKRNITPDGE